MGIIPLAQIFLVWSVLVESRRFSISILFWKT